MTKCLSHFLDYNIYTYMFVYLQKLYMYSNNLMYLYLFLNKGPLVILTLQYVHFWYGSKAGPTRWSGGVLMAALFNPFTVVPLESEDPC